MSNAVGELWVCAVPIGNLGDASPRLVEALKGADIIACEDTRITQHLLNLLEIETDARLLAHHEHNERDSTRGLISALINGARVCVVSDAGSPAVSDPGTILVAAAHEAGIPVRAIPGPSAVVAALSVSGFQHDFFQFNGFMPRSKSEIKSLLLEQSSNLFVAFESPQRILKTLAIVEDYQSGRKICVARELTKKFEETLRGTATQVLSILRERKEIKGEFAIVFAPFLVTQRSSKYTDALKLVELLLADGIRLKRATVLAGQTFDVPARDLYAHFNKS